MRRQMIRFTTVAMVLFASVCLPVLAASSVDPTGTVIVANMSDNTVTIIDVASRATVATLPTGSAPHEIAVSRDQQTAVVTNYGVRGAAGSSLTVIDLKSLSVARTIDLGIYERPHGIAFVRGDSIVAVTSEVKQAVVLVNVETGDITGVVSTTQRASHMLAASADGGHVFTTNVVDGTVSSIDTVSEELASVISVAPMVEGIASSPDGDVLFVGSNSRKTVNVVDVPSGVVVDSLVGFGFPYRMAVTPDGGTAVLSDPARGEIRIVDVATRKEHHRVVVSRERIVASSEFADSPSPEGIALSADGTMAYVALQGRNEVAFVDLASGAITATVATGTWPDGIGYSALTR